MKKYYQFQSFLLTIATLMLISCGPSLEEIQAREKARQISSDSLANIKLIVATERAKAIESVTSTEEEITKPKCWIGSDVGLPTGTVTRVEEAYANDITYYWIEIELPNGTFTIIKDLDVVTYNAINAGDIIK